ncbi:MAG: hypothetical protein A2Y12_18405 [Planctomycetes bacterium GWF2_42_9]|nr:MAG: hypothetical protein A2Y12_18405 [Planctomycetes bacterium GWF2_42_9]
MQTDVLILNTLVADFRSSDFEYTRALTCPGGMVKCRNVDMPNYSQQQLKKWIQQGFVTVGGPGNVAPLIAKAGLRVAIGGNLGKGDYDGLDAQGRFIFDMMAEYNVDLSGIRVHPELATGTTFICEKSTKERAGIAYFPNANDEFDFECFKDVVVSLNPKIVYYMYSGISEKGDANEGKDLAEFIKWCRNKGIITIADSVTLVGNPQKLIHSGTPVTEYKLLIPLLPEVDLFFTSSDEAKMIVNTLGAPRNWSDFTQDENNHHVLNFLTSQFWRKENRPRIFGVTVNNGVYEKHNNPNGASHGPNRVESRFMCDDVVDLVGAGDAFRTGLICYIAKNISEFKTGMINYVEAIQMGNLFAALYIKAPLQNRYCNLKSYPKMYELLQNSSKNITFRESAKMKPSN